jgi:ATP-dependent RNA helicase RhlE
MALSFCDQEERAYLKLIQKLINKTLTVQDKHPFLPQDPRFFMDIVAPSKSPNDRRPSKNSSHRGGNKRPVNSSPRREEEKKSWFRKR